MADLQEMLGRVIRRERQDRNMTIKELGDKAGLSEIYVGEIERGQKYPSAKVLESLAQALELDLAEFLNWWQMKFAASGSHRWSQTPLALCCPQIAINHAASSLSVSSICSMRATWRV